MLRLARYDSERDNEPEIYEASWPEVVEALTTHEMTSCGASCTGKTCPMKKGTAFSPAPPTKAPYRLDKNVEWVYMLAFDFDGITWDELEGVCSRLEGVESLLYTTHSHLHDGPEDCRVRIVIPLLRPVTPSEFYVLHAELCRRGLQWRRPGAAKISGADPVVKDVSRLFFLPTAPVGSRPFVGYMKGAPLDIETLLREAPQAARNAVPAPRVSAPPKSKPSPSNGPVDMEALRQALRDYKPRNTERDEGKIHRKELVRRVLAQEPLVKHEETGLRNDAVHRLGSILGHVLPAHAPEEAVVELVRQSINTLPVYSNDDEGDALDKRFEAFCLAWKRGVESAEGKRAALEVKRQTERELHKKLKQRFRIKGPDEHPSPSGVEVDGEESAEEELNLENWEELFVKTKKGDVWSVGTNVELVLDAHPEWRGKLSYNEFTKTPEFEPDAPVYISDSEEAVTAVQLWFQSEYKINLQRQDIMVIIRHCAKRNSFNPIKDYLYALEWDGGPRINGWLKRYCGARLTDGDGGDETLVERMGRRWLMSAVARALEPGCKADTVLILEGEQGLKKSMVFEVLAGEKWFTDSPVHIGEKDAMQIIGMKWIIELAELSAFHGSETEQQKGFFSSRADTFRPPFGLVPQSFPRQSVCGATTNKTNYMNDETGNRRFWAVWCEKILIADLERDRDQLWAEAVHYYKQGLACAECKRLKASNDEARCPEHRWWFEPKENVELERANTERLRNDYADGIVDYMLKLKPEERPIWLTMHDICRQLSISSDRIASQSSAVSRALKFLEFTPGRMMQDGVRMRVFYMPETLLKAPLRAKVRGPPRIHLVEPPKEGVEA
jgi:hypothetical protein